MRDMSKSSGLRELIELSSTRDPQLDGLPRVDIFYYMSKGWDARAMMPTREYSGGRIHTGIQEGCHSFCRCLEDLTGRDDENDVGAVKTAPDVVL